MSNKNAAGLLLRVIVPLSLLILLSLLFSPGNLFKVQTAVKNKEEKIVEFFDSHPEILHWLENELYENEHKVYISYEANKIKFEENGSKTEIDSNLEQQLITMFKKLDCSSIRLYCEDGTKILKIGFNNVHASYKNVFVSRLIYCGEKEHDSGDEIIPNWYFEVLWYT